MKQITKEKLTKVIEFLRIKKSPDFTTILLVSTIMFQIFAFFAYRNGLL